MSNLLIRADARRIPLADGSVHSVVTSPPYFGLRDYGTGRWEGGDAGCDHKNSNARPDQSNGVMLGTRGERGGNTSRSTPMRGTCGRCGARRVDLQVGLEPTPAEYVAGIVAVFREVRRVLRKDGTIWVNIGDSYAGGGGGNYGEGKSVRSQGGQQVTNVRNRPAWLSAAGAKAKDMLGIPWMLALALRDDGWYLRSDVTWHKNNPMPSSARDRPAMADERLFLLAKSPRYYFDKVALPPDRRRTVWTIPTAPTKHAHFATFPWRLVEPCVLAGTSAKGCCGACGAPVRRVVERTRAATRPALDNKDDASGKANRDPGRHVTVVKTVGWEATCGCGADRVPCRVLDPFAGACTTGLACGLHGRDFVGLDLSLDYLLDIGRPRLARGLIPRAGRERKRRGDLPGQTLLFDSLLPGVVPQETPA